MESTTSRKWRPNWPNLALELTVIFVGVTAAFFVESLRERMEAEEDLRQATAGIVAELETFDARGEEYVELFRAGFERWRQAQAHGSRQVPELYFIRGALRPPSAAWDAAVASGVASLYEPDLRYRLGYFYSEFVGIHVNYARHIAFFENEVLPRMELGPEAFYDESGLLEARIRSRISLMEAYVNDLERLSELAGELAEELDAKILHGEALVSSDVSEISP